MKSYRESDNLIVSEKSPNKTGDKKPVAEEMEKRRLAERNPSKQNRNQAQNWAFLPSELERIRYAARSNATHARHYLKQEPSALAVHAGICTGGVE